MVKSPRSILSGADLVSEIPDKVTTSNCAPSITTFGSVDQANEIAVQTSDELPWVATLLATKFYGNCPTHDGMKKNDLNRFCIGHCTKICQYCHKDEHSSPCSILHVSRYMYHDVLLAKEISMWLGVADVQSYLNNGNRVVYIDRRAQAKSKLAPHAKSCVVCSRTLQDPFLYCSVYCRLFNSSNAPFLDQIPVPGAFELIPTPSRHASRAGNGDRTGGNRRDRGSKIFVRKGIDEDIDESDPIAEHHDVDTSDTSCVDCDNSISSPASSPTISNALHLNPGITKSRRKGRPQLSPLASPRQIVLLRQNLMPLFV